MGNTCLAIMRACRTQVESLGLATTCNPSSGEADTGSLPFLGRHPSLASDVYMHVHMYLSMSTYHPPPTHTGISFSKFLADYFGNWYPLLSVLSGCEFLLIYLTSLVGLRYLASKKKKKSKIYLSPSHSHTYA